MSCKWLLCVTFLIAQLFEGKGLHPALTWSDVELLGSFLQKYRKKSGPKGPSPDLIRAVVEMKQHNRSCGRPSHCRTDRLHLYI